MVCLQQLPACYHDWNVCRVKHLVQFRQMLHTYNANSYNKFSVDIVKKSHFEEPFQSISLYSQRHVSYRSIVTRCNIPYHHVNKPTCFHHSRMCNSSRQHNQSGVSRGKSESVQTWHSMIMSILEGSMTVKPREGYSNLEVEWVWHVAWRHAIGYGQAFQVKRTHYRHLLKCQCEADKMCITVWHIWLCQTVKGSAKIF